MGELQCTLEFSVELQKFINVDLFQRGFYQVRTSLRVSPKFPSKIEVNLPKNSTCSLVFPACIVNGTAVSKTFQILYKNEEVQLDDIVVFKVHVLVEGHRVRETLLKSDMQVVIELWFTDQNFGPDQHNSIHCVSTRTLQLHFDPARGLHHHLPLLFDYFHLCAVTVTIHASILALCQPYLSIQRPSKQNFLTGSPRLSNKKSHSSMETVLFGLPAGRITTSTARLYRARLIHWELCHLLLYAHNSLCRKLMEYMNLLPPWQQLKLESIENSSYLENLSDFAKECHKHLKTNPLVPPSKEQLFGSYDNMENEDDFLAKANSDIAQMCGALILIWQQFLEIVVGREKVRQHLSRQRHFQRVKRFSEAFFIVERTRDSALAPCDSSVEAYQEVSEGLRRSSYLSLLPPLEVECVELDGDSNSLPILYEEHYQETARRGSNNSHSSQSESTVSLSDVNFLVDESLDGKSNSERRNSQGSLGQKSRSPDISATPTSPSAFSWCPEVSVSSPLPAKSNPVSTKKPSLKDKLFNNFKVELESDCEEYNVTSGMVVRGNHKVNVRSKIRLRSRTVNFLKQLKKPHFSQGPNSVVLLGVKKLDASRSVACGLAKASRIPFALENGIRHSQSTLSVMSTLYGEGRSCLPNSESMPDLTSGFIPPPPPPPRSRYASSDLEWTALDLSIRSTPKVPPSPSYIPPERKTSCSRNSSSPIPHIQCSVELNSNNPNETQRRRAMFQSCSSQKANSSSRENDPSSDKQRSKVGDVWKDSLDEVFVNSSKSKNEIAEIHSRCDVVSSQPTKSKEGYIFKNVEDNSSVKFEPPPPLLLNEMGNADYSPDISGPNITEICPPSPPVQFRDPPLKNRCNYSDQVNNSEGAPNSVKNKLSPIKIFSKSDSSWVSHGQDSCLTSLICQGTLFFPKPPAEFAGDDVEDSQPIDVPGKKNATGTPKFEKSHSNGENININYLKVNDGSQTSKDFNNESKTEEYASCSKVEIDEQGYFETKCTILEMLTDFSDPEDCYLPATYNSIPLLQSNNVGERYRSHSLATPNASVDEDIPSVRRASVIGTEIISFVKAKEEFRKQLRYPWLWYSDFPSLASAVPYFQCDSDLRAFSPEGMHLVVCVHGLDGNSADLRLVRTYLELGLPTVNFEFLMSERNQGETFDDFDTMTDRLVSEISYYIEVYGLKPIKISFIGHSLGNIIIRSALTRPEMKPYLSRLHTFLSLSGPHLGTLYNSSGLVNMGMWFMQKWKKSGSLLQLAMKDSSDLRQTFLYKLSQKSGLEHFRNILLFGSSQDRYVPLHSARIEICKPALKDSSLQGIIYREMVTNLIQPIIEKTDVALLRYDVHHALPSSANSLIGRAAHIAVLDSELFIEKFLAVCGLRFFT